MEQKELFEQAKGAKSAEELVSLAKENGMELTEEEAAAYFAQLNKSGELSDEERDRMDQLRRVCMCKMRPEKQGRSFSYHQRPAHIVYATMYELQIYVV